MRCANSHPRVAMGRKNKPALPSNYLNNVSKQTTTARRRHEGDNRLTRSGRSRWKKHRTKYEYDPFLGVTRASGALAFVNPFLGSTKFFDAETGLYYYGYRYYDPSGARWLSRDPIAEQGGINDYSSAGNDLLNFFDYLGLAYGKHLTKEEAESLACQINDWLLLVRIGDDLGRIGEKITGKKFHWTFWLLAHYMGKSGEMFSMPYSAISGEPQVKQANDGARTALAGKRSGVLTEFLAKTGWRNEDIRTSLGRVRFHYRLDHNFSILGEVLDHYTFLDTRPEENKRVPFDYLTMPGVGCGCGWKGGEIISDDWMADLERYGHAKSFITHIEWNVPNMP